MLPDFVVIGCQRGGTSSLYRYLGTHPDIAPSLRKESEYFTIRYDEGETWYRAHFPLRLRRTVMRWLGRDLLTFEATPDYLLDPRAAARCHDLLPDAKIIVLLREPGERALSHFHHNRRLGLESENFSTAIELEALRIKDDVAAISNGEDVRAVAFRRFSYLKRGEYAEQLERWFAAYPPDRFLILESEEFFSNPPQVFQRVLDFVGSRHWTPHSFRNFSYLQDGAQTVHSAVPEELEGRVGDRFAEPNKALAQLIDVDLKWLSSDH